MPTFSHTFLLKNSKHKCGRTLFRSKARLITDRSIEEILETTEITMADGDAVRTATAVSEEVNISEVKVTLCVDGLIPPMFGTKKQPKNGTADVTFTNRGFTMAATIRKSSGEETQWRFQVTQLPSNIIPNKSSWKVDKGKIILNLFKEEETSWAPMLRRGLEQADSEDEED